MADKKIVNEAFRKGATEKPNMDKTKVSALDVKTNEHGLEIIAGQDAIDKLVELGVSVSADGSMSLKSTDNVTVIMDNGEIVRKQKEELTLEEKQKYVENEKAKKADKDELEI